MSITILLCDDHQIIRQSIKNLLARDSEIQIVAEATSLKETIRLARELKPQILVMDLHMGDERNFESGEVKSVLAGSRILAVSVWNDNESKILADSYGAASLLDKMSLANQLIPTIKRLAGFSETN